MNVKKLRNPYYIKRELSYISLYLPALLLFLLFVVWPLIQAIYFSMTDCASQYHCNPKIYGRSDHCAEYDGTCACIGVESKIPLAQCA